MAKRRRTERPPRAKQTSKDQSAIEKGVVAFAEQVGRFAGSVQAKAEGWIDAKGAPPPPVSSRRPKGPKSKRRKP